MKRIILTSALLMGISAANAAALRQNTATLGLVELYPEANFGGSPVVLSTEGVYEEDYPNATNRSIKVKKGYVAVIYPRDNDAYYFVKPEDDSDFSDESGFTITPWNKIYKIKVEKLIVPNIRPRIFLTLHGNNELGDSQHDGKWTYVQDHVDGIWWNAALTSQSMRNHVIGLIRNKNIVEEKAGNSAQYGFDGPDLNNTNLNRDDLLPASLRNEITFESLGIYNGSGLQTISPTQIDEMKFEYMEKAPAAGKKNYNGTMGVWHIGNFSNTDQYQHILDYPDALKMFDEGSGNCVELASAHFMNNPVYRNGLIWAMQRTHANGQPFYWFMTRHSPINVPVEELYVESDPITLQNMKNAYYMMEYLGLIRETDVYFLIAYRNTLRCYPEADAEGNEVATNTGITYWMLRQGQQDVSNHASLLYSENFDDEGTGAAYNDGTTPEVNVGGIGTLESTGASQGGNAGDTAWQFNAAGPSGRGLRFNGQHNWATGANSNAILSAGGFSISLDYTIVGADATQWVSARLANNGELDDGVNAAATDFGVLARGNGVMQTFENGAASVDFGTVTANAPRSVEFIFEFDSWAAGTTVTFTGIMDGTPIASDTFTWDKTDDLQILFGGNNDGALIDNITIGTIKAIPALLTIGSNAGNMLVGATNMTDSATYTLQGIDSLTSTNWLDLAYTTGVSSVEWQVPVTSKVYFIRVITE